MNSAASPILTSRRRFIGTVILAGCGLPSCRQLSSSDLLTDLKEGLTKHIDNLNQRLGIDRSASSAGLSSQECEKEERKVYAIISDFATKTGEKLDLNEPATREFSAIEYLLSKNLLINHFKLQIGDKFIPLFSLSTVEARPDFYDRGYSEHPDLKAYGITGELTRPISKDVFEGISGMTLNFRSGTHAVIINQESVNSGAANYRKNGFKISDQQQLKYVLENEFGNYKFNRKYEFLKNSKKTIILKPGTKAEVSFDFMQLSEAYSDLESFAPNQTFGLNVLRISESQVPQYQLSSALMRKGLVNFAASHPKVLSQSELKGSRFALAIKIADDPELTEQLVKFMRTFYQSFFQSQIDPIWNQAVK